jgi:Zn-dependent M28 family amino/carboxypeptidase
MIINQKTLKTEKSTWKFNNADLTNVVLVMDTGFHDKKNTKLQSAQALIEISDSPFIWSVAGSEEMLNHPRLKVLRSALPKKYKNVSFDINNTFYSKYPTQNICGYIRGSVVPDSFIVFTAHYDHLGEMGQGVVFPGANDNASGTAMLLDLARYYTDTINKPYYSVAFLFFTGEEAGLYGSEYYTGHPLFSLQQIRFLINLDMVGTGSEGIKVVNGSLLTKEFEVLKSLNDKTKLLKNVSPRAESSGSDHYYFYKKGVPCFFIYTLGKEYKEYHNINDKAAGLPLTAYDGLFKLVTGFVSSFSSEK